MGVRRKITKFNDYVTLLLIYYIFQKSSLCLPIQIDISWFDTFLSFTIAGSTMR